MDKVKEWASLPMQELLMVASRKRRMEEVLCRIVRHVPPTIQSVKELD